MGHPPACEHCWGEHTCTGRGHPMGPEVREAFWKRNLPPASFPSSPRTWVTSHSPRRQGLKGGLCDQ